MIQPRNGRNGFPWGEKLLEVYRSNLSARLKSGGYTLGVPELICREQNNKSLPYSLRLHALVAECLLVSPASRISPADLVRETKKGTEACRRINGRFPEFRGELPDQYKEPDLSERCYSGQRRAKPRYEPKDADMMDGDEFDLLVASGGLGGLRMGEGNGLGGGGGGLEGMFGGIDQEGGFPIRQPNNTTPPARRSQSPGLSPLGLRGHINAQAIAVTTRQRALPASRNLPPPPPLRVQTTPPVPRILPPPPPRRVQFAPLPPRPQSIGGRSALLTDRGGLSRVPVTLPLRSAFDPLPAPIPRASPEAPRESLRAPNINSAGRYRTIVFDIRSKKPMGKRKIATMRK